MIIAFTGHRPNKLGGYGETLLITSLRAVIKNIFLTYKPDYIITGMALGVDTIAAEICLECKIPYIAAIPFVGQESRWPAQSQNHYRDLLKEASSVIVVSDGGYSAEKMQIRNKFMVDHADMLVAVWDGTSGGTANCINYARSLKNKSIYFIRIKDGKIVSLQP